MKTSIRYPFCPLTIKIVSVSAGVCHLRTSRLLCCAGRLQDMKKAEKKEEITIEELVEKERAALGSNLTKITYTTFLAWKKRKLAERRKEESKKQAKKKSDAKSGKSGGVSRQLRRGLV